MNLSNTEIAELMKEVAFRETTKQIKQKVLTTYLSVGHSIHIFEAIAAPL